MTKEKSNKATYHHGDLRKTLLDDAALLLREHGEAGLSMRNLADRAGVSRTAAYHHFQGKNDLLCAIAEEGFRRYREVIYPEGLWDEPPVDQLKIQQFISNYIDFAINNSEYYDLMFGGNLWKSEQVTKTLTEEAHGAFRAYTEGIRSWQNIGAISEKVDALRYAQVSWSTMHGMSRLLIDGIYLNNDSRKAMCEAAAGILWRELNPT